MNVFDRDIFDALIDYVIIGEKDINGKITKKVVNSIHVMVEFHTEKFK